MIKSFKLLKLLTTNFSQKQHGFTLAEVLVTTVISGILMAVSAVSIAGMYEQEKVRNSVGELHSTLQEARAQAQRKGRRCSVSLNTTDNEVSSGDGCLLEAVVNLASNEILKISTNINGTPPSITFSYQGKIFVDAGSGTEDGVIVMSRANAKTNQGRRCLLIPVVGTAPIKPGVYNDDNLTVTPDKCLTD